LVVQESDGVHGWSKLIGGECLLTLITLGFGAARPMGVGSAAADSPGWLRAMKLPSFDAALPANVQGYTTATGEVFVNPVLSKAERLLTLRHESVHAFLTPTGSGPIASARQFVGAASYRSSAFLQATEEIIAETFASGSLRQGLAHAFNGAYSTPLYGVTPLTYTLEAGGIGATIYGFYEALKPTAEEIGEDFGG
jgi:hypothetical protein